MKKIPEDAILSYIEGHLDEHVGAEEVACAFGYSPDHFRHLFRTYYDISLGEYIRRRRLVGAAKQIQKGVSVSSAAQKYDFQTAAGFSKAFRKEFGIPASELNRSCKWYGNGTGILCAGSISAFQRWKNFSL